MPIIIGQNGVASDFINESQKNATPSNDEGRVPKLEDNAKISAKFLSSTESDIVLGETIDGTTTPKACFISEGNDEPFKFIENTGTTNSVDNRLDGNGAYNAWTAQTFNTGNCNRINKLYWDCGNAGISSDDSVAYYVYATDGSGKPTGSALVSGGNNDDWSGVFSFADLTVTPNTDYAFVIKGDSSAGDYYEMYMVDDNNAGFDYVVQGSSDGVSWSNTGKYARDFYAEGYTYLEKGKVFKSDKDVIQRNYFDGFVYESGVLDDVVGIRQDSSKGFTGLTDGDYYYIDTDGDIALTGGITVGKAITDTVINVSKTSIGRSLQIGLYDGSGGFSFSKTFDKTGFVYGKIVPSSDPAYLTFTSGETTLSQSWLPGDGNISVFCLPVTSQDILTISSTDGRFQAFFRPLF